MNFILRLAFGLGPFEQLVQGQNRNSVQYARLSC